MWHDNITYLPSFFSPTSSIDRFTNQSVFIKTFLQDTCAFFQRLIKKKNKFILMTKNSKNNKVQWLHIGNCLCGCFSNAFFATETLKKDKLAFFYTTKSLFSSTCFWENYPNPRFTSSLCSTGALKKIYIKIIFYLYFFFNRSKNTQIRPFRNGNALSIVLQVFSCCTHDIVSLRTPSANVTFHFVQLKPFPPSSCSILCIVCC